MFSIIVWLLFLLNVCMCLISFCSVSQGEFICKKKRSNLSRIMLQNFVYKEQLSLSIDEEVQIRKEDIDSTLWTHMSLSIFCLLLPCLQMLEESHFSTPPSSPPPNMGGAPWQNPKASSVSWCTDYLSVMGCAKPHNFKVRVGFTAAFV